MKKTFTLLAALTLTQISVGQVMICDFDAVKKISFKDYTGKLDSMFVNPMQSGANTSSMCARYIRDTAQYDNVKFYAHTKFGDVAPFASAAAVPKISMKIWSKMPIGSKVDIQMGTRNDQSWPTGVHSEYSAATTKQGEWEMLTFIWTGNPTNGFPLSGSVDKGVILFKPNSHNRDTIYFDDLMGPVVEEPNGINEMINSNLSVSQNQPNPAKDNTTININLNTSGHVNIVVYDLLGKAVKTVTDSNLEIGAHAFTLNTESLPNGVYFYTVKKGSDVKTLKMTVSK